MEIDGDTIEVIEEEYEDADGTEIYAEEVGIEFNDESTDGFSATTHAAKSGGGPVTIYRLIKLEHAEALGISLQEGSVTTPNQTTKIITRNIIKLNRPPRQMVLAQKNNTPDVSNVVKECPTDSSYHGVQKKFVCVVCNKGFRHASHLKRHVNSHTGEKLYDCEACGKRFLDASTLCRHRRTHTGDRPYVCKICQKCFGTLGSLRRHVTVHNQEGRPHGCHDCAKRFPDNSSFRKHRLIHAGVRPFSCEACGKAFVHVGDLNGHRKVHEETKPWKCPRCDKQFSKQSNCARHSLIHEGDNKEFVCHLCGVGYNFQGSLTRHLLTHRAREKPARKQNRKVVIMTEVERKDGADRSEELEPSKLTLRQIKYLVRENKICFGNGSEDDEEGYQAKNKICIREEEEETVEGETTDEYNGEGENTTTTEESTKVSLSEETNNEKETIIIKQVSEDGNIKYIIEEA